MEYRYHDGEIQVKLWDTDDEWMQSAHDEAPESDIDTEYVGHPIAALLREKFGLEI
jgi:hypothetical protein